MRGCCKSRQQCCDECGTTIDSGREHGLIRQEKDRIDPRNVETFCDNCFKQLSRLDFEENDEVVEPVQGNGAVRMNLVWLATSGTSRRVFYDLALSFAEDYACRSVLLDFPGTGSRVDESLTMESAVAVVLDTVEKRLGHQQQRSMKTVLIGASLGGFLGAQILGHHNDEMMFNAGVLISAGHDFGPSRSCLTSCGLCCIGQYVKAKSEVSMLKEFATDLPKNEHLDYDTVLHGLFQTGIFFGQIDSIIRVVREIDMNTALPRVKVPILILTGTSDLHSSHDRWAVLCKHEKSSSKMYQGGDHYFFHDTRFKANMIRDIASFFEEIGDQTTMITT